MNNDKLSKYNFKDDHGHPLENCREYIELREKAEKWNEYCAKTFLPDQYENIAGKLEAQLNLLMQGLVVEEKCSTCHDTGTITRPARPEEVREFLECIFTEGENNDKFLHNYTGVTIRWFFELKSGAILRMEK